MLIDLAAELNVNILCNAPPFEVAVYVKGAQCDVDSAHSDHV